MVIARLRFKRCGAPEIHYRKRWLNQFCLFNPRFQLHSQRVRSRESCWPRGQVWKSRISLIPHGPERLHLLFFFVCAVYSALAPIVPNVFLHFLFFSICVVSVGLGISHVPQDWELCLAIPVSHRWNVYFAVLVVATSGRWFSRVSISLSTPFSDLGQFSSP